MNSQIASCAVGIYLSHIFCLALKIIFFASVSNISFNIVEVSFAFSSESKVIKWLEQIADDHSAEIKGLSYIFCDDEYLLNINKEYLDHDYYTDIITFPYQQGQTLESDIFISIDRVAENASNYNVDFETELRRVIAHGILHLLGYKDKTTEEQEEMKAQEDKCLSLWQASYHK